MVYSYQGKTPSLSVYDNKTQVSASTSNPSFTVKFDATQNTMTINFGTTSPPITNNGKIRIGGEFQTADQTAASHINGREFTVTNVDTTTDANNKTVTINTTGLSFPDDGFTLTEADIYVMSNQSEKLEAFFEGASNVYEGAEVNFSSQKIVIREIGDCQQACLYQIRN